jgi:hypothetical protein
MSDLHVSSIIYFYDYYILCIFAIIRHFIFLSGWVGACAAGRRAGAGLVGLSLSYALAITGLLNSALTSAAETEQEMVAVERILDYADLPPQARFPSCRMRPSLSCCAGSCVSRRVCRTGFWGCTCVTCSGSLCSACLQIKGVTRHGLL